MWGHGGSGGGHRALQARKAGLSGAVEQQQRNAVDEAAGVRRSSRAARCAPLAARRSLRNLKEIHRSSDDLARLFAVLQRLVILLPEAWEERRDRGLAAARLGVVKTAVADLSAYLEHVPHAGDRFAITERLIELGHGDPSRLH